MENEEAEVKVVPVHEELEMKVEGGAGRGGVEFGFIRFQVGDGNIYLTLCCATVTDIVMVTVMVTVTVSVVR